MKKEFTILIADRNPHVRGFLKRELAAEGFIVIMADSAQDLLRWTFGQTPVDLLLIDPDLPDMESEALMERLNSRIPPIPVVIHTLPEERKKVNLHQDIVVYVEKGGHSIEQLKEVIHRVRSGKPTQALSEQ
ncbi:MAG: response regulator [Desulfobacterales bacterium]|nr:response regulator [Desulfobacterales bacterium]